MALLVDELEVKFVPVDRGRPADYRFDVDLEEGSHEVAAGFLNDARSGQGRSQPLSRADHDRRAAGRGRTGRDLSARKTLKTRRGASARSSRPPVRRSTGTGNPTRSSAWSIPPASPSQGARVTVTQTGHEFLFGCNIYGFDHARTEAQNAAYKTAVRGAVQLRHRRLLLAVV